MTASFRDRLISRLAHLIFLLRRPMTLGVRGVVIAADESILLVRHGYVSGWHFPGGGVEPGETCEEALTRELEEEARVKLEGPPALHGVFFNGRVSRRDHVAVYVVRHFRQDRLPEPNREIIDCGFFAITALPEGTTFGTQLRIAEVLDGKPLIATWR